MDLGEKESLGGHLGEKESLGGHLGEKESLGERRVWVDI